MKHRLLFFLCGFCLPACSQPWSSFLDSSRAIDWTGVGFAIPNYTVACSHVPALVANNPSSAFANSLEIQAALNSCDSTHNVVNIPAGTYYTTGWTYGTQGKQVVRGAGPMSTTLKVMGMVGCSGLWNAVCMTSSNPIGPGSPYVQPGGGLACSWTAAGSTPGQYQQGATSITLSSCGGTPPLNQMLVLDQANDTSDTNGIYICDIGTAGCAVEGAYNQDGRIISGVTHSEQQVVYVTGVTSLGGGSYTVTISPGIYFNNIRTAQTPGAWWEPTTVQNDGIESLTIDQSYRSPAPTIGTPTSGGSCTPGTHSATVRSFNAAGEPTITTLASSVFTCVLTTGQTVPMTIPLGPTGTVSRVIYITAAGNVGNHIKVATLSDNTTTAFSMTAPDSSLVGGDDGPVAGGLTMFTCYQCWVKNVRSLNGGTAHVYMTVGLGNIVRDSYFYQASAHGPLSYGVEATLVSGLLVENNIFQQITDSVIFGQSSGSVIDYNYAVYEGFENTDGSLSTWAQTATAGHNAGNGMNLWEGNNFFGIWSDISFGTSSVSTFFRNQLRGWQSPLNIYAIFPVLVDTGTRAFNYAGNVLGQPTYHTVYESYAASTTGGVNGGEANADHSIYALGWGNQVGGCSPSPPVCDALVRPTLMRWGNYDTVNAGVRWDTGEASPAAVPYVNANFTSTYFGSLAHTLPSSLYYAAKPSWWPAAKAWPANGPDVSSGNLGICNGGTYAGAQATLAGQCTGGTLTSAYAGHANSIPSQDCYLSVMQGPPNGNGNVLNFDAGQCYGSSVGKPASPTGFSTVVH